MVTPLQSLRIFGMFDQPRETVCWEDVKSKKLSWSQLRQIGFDGEALFAMQSDKQAWISHGLIELSDCLDAMIFPLNPLLDMQADLGELWNMQLSCENLKSMGVTYDVLVKKGMTPEIMYYFNFSIAEWMTLGFDADKISKDHENVFQMSQAEITSILKTF